MIRGNKSKTWEWIMVRDLVHWSCIAALALALGACGMARIPIDAPKDPIRIEATVVIKHEYLLVESTVGQ